MNMNIEKIKNQVKEIRKAVPFTNEDEKEFLEVLGLEKLNDYGKEWLLKDGDFIFIEEKNKLIDMVEKEEYEEASIAIYNNGWESDFVFWLLEKDDIEIKIVLLDWREKREREFLTLDEVNKIFAKEAEKRWGLDYEEVLENLRTDGKIGWEIRYALLGEETSLFDHEDPITGEWLVPKMLRVSHCRHTMTDYDNIDKTFLSEDEVDQLRKEANKYVKHVFSKK